MSTRKGTAYRVFATETANTGKSVTEVTVKLDDIGDKQVAFYIPADGPQPVYGDGLEWGTDHVTVTRATDGSTFTVHKIGFDFDPDEPLR